MKMNNRISLNEDNSSMISDFKKKVAILSVLGCTSSIRFIFCGKLGCTQDNPDFNTKKEALRLMQKHI